MCVLQKARDEFVSADEAATARGHGMTNGGAAVSDKSDAYHQRNGSTKMNPRGGPITAEHLKFDVTLDDLKELMQLKDKEAVDVVAERYESVDKLATKGLDSDLVTGIKGDEADIAKRIELYGRNEIPPKPSKSFLRLAFEASRDPTLVMLMICAVVSIGLSFYHPTGDTTNQEYRIMDSKEEANLEWIEGAAIIIAVLIVVGVTAFNDWRKERQFRGLQDRIESDNLTSVVRQGQLIQINVKDLVVGDICCIKYGDLIPADGLVVEASDLKIDEASLTGETDLVKKNTTSNIVILSGTHVMEGSGKFLVLAVGVNSQTGIIMELLGAAEETTKYDKEKEEAAKVKKDSKKIYTSIGSNGEKKKNSSESEEDEGEEKQSKRRRIKDKLKRNKKPAKKSKYPKKHLSVLQVKLGKLALQIGYCGISGAILTFIILVVRMCIEEFGIKKNPWSNNYIKYMISFLIQAITVIVVAVPEGLPLAVTLALAFAVRRMTKDNNLVRHLDACETMGSATTICSDKTGTLTTNRMTAVECWVDDQYFTAIPDKAKISDLSRELIYESISVNSNYTSRIEKPKQQGELPKQIGNKTECGLLGLVTDLGGDYDAFRASYPSEELVKVYTFNSARKMMSTVVRMKTSSSGYRLHSKGASEIVLEKCGFYINSQGEPEELSVEKKEKIVREVIEPMARNGLRTLCVAYRDFLTTQGDQSINVNYVEKEPDWDGDETSLIANMTCICLVGIEDPVRPEVPDAIRKCQSGGVVVRMVTGDNINTATSIAIKCGIVKPGDDFLILESKEFNKRIKDENGVVKQELLDRVWPKLRVLARSSPQDKYILVNGIVESKLNPNREVVAVTGDGTNDGPALKRADVGFAMGIQGTDVAKEASDIILTDDNFSSIVKAMMWGRNVYDSIAKFLQFQLTANLAAGIFSVVCAATIQAVPLKAVQMLWVNLVMDTLASLALATEPPSEDLLNRRPYGRNKPIISLIMLKNIIGHAIYQLIVLFVLVFCIDTMMQVDSMVQYEDLTLKAQPSVHFTIIFNAFIFMTLFNEFNARKIHDERNVFSGLSRNPYFIGIWVVCLIGQILIVNFGGIVFAVEPLDLHEWMWCVFFGLGSLLWGQLLACIPKSVVKKIVHKVLFWRYRAKKEKKNGEAAQEEADYFNEEDNNIDNIEIEKEQLDKSTAHWIRGASRIHDQLQVVETFRKSLDKADSELDDDDDDELQVKTDSTEASSKPVVA